MISDLNNAPRRIKIVDDPDNVEFFVPRKLRGSNLPVSHYIASDDEHETVLFYPQWEDRGLSEFVVAAYNYAAAHHPALKETGGETQ